MQTRGLASCYLQAFQARSPHLRPSRWGVWGGCTEDLGPLGAAVGPPRSASRAHRRRRAPLAQLAPGDSSSQVLGRELGPWGTSRGSRASPFAPGAFLPFEMSGRNGEFSQKCRRWGCGGALCEGPKGPNGWRGARQPLTRRRQGVGGCRAGLVLPGKSRSEAPRPYTEENFSRCFFICCLHALPGCGRRGRRGQTRHQTLPCHQGKVGGSGCWRKAPHWGSGRRYWGRLHLPDCRRGPLTGWVMRIHVTREAFFYENLSRKASGFPAIPRPRKRETHKGMGKLARALLPCFRLCWQRWWLHGFVIMCKFM